MNLKEFLAISLLCWLLGLTFMDWVFYKKYIDVKEIELQLYTKTVILDKKIFFLSREVEDLKRKLNLDVKLCTVTAYSASRRECDDTPDITASGEKVKEGFIAVSRDLFSKGWTFNKRVYIPSLKKIFIIKDLMNKRWRRRLDIFMPSRKAAKKFGKKRLIAILIF